MGHSFSNGFESGLLWARIAHASTLRLRDTMRSKTRSAPATVYPVTRSRLQACSLCSIWACGTLVGLFWGFTAPISSWRLCAVVVAVVVSAGAAIWGMKQTSQGSLRWDRLVWTFLKAKPHGENHQPLAGTLAVYLDLQSFLLVRFHSDAGHKQWLWLDRGAEPRAWLALRRAVYSPGPNRDLKRLNSTPVASGEDI